MVAIDDEKNETNKKQKQKRRTRERELKNILVCGTPGSGKSTLCEALLLKLNDHGGRKGAAIENRKKRTKKAKKTEKDDDDDDDDDRKYQLIDISDIVKQNKFYEEFDEQLDTYVINEDEVLDFLEPLVVPKGGLIVDYHSSEFFPERFFDLVIVLTCDNTILYERLAKREYTQMKIMKNIECEIFGECVEEAKESYREEIVFVRKNETVEQMEDTISFICKELLLGGSK